MRIRFASLTFCVLIVVIAFGCGTDSVSFIQVPEKLTLYSIDGTAIGPNAKKDAEEYFHDFPVLGKVKINEPEKRKEIISALKRGIARSDGMAAKCFWPRHGIRAVQDGKTIDYVICFECYQLEAYLDSETKGLTTTREPQKVFNRHLREAGIPMAPGMKEDNE
jgi:hypothetical protein